MVRPANAGEYILSIDGPATVEPGQQFQVVAELSGSGVLDSFIFDVHATGPRSLIYNGYLLDPVAFQTGGADDFSVPKGALNTGIFTPPILLGSARFEAVTRSGQIFGTGDLVKLDLRIPLDANPGEAFVVQGSPDCFAFDLDCNLWAVGPPLRFTVVPEPFTITFLALGALLMSRRRSRISLL